MCVYLSCTTIQRYIIMSKQFTTSEFISFIKGVKPVNESGVCSISVDKNNIELIYNYNTEDNSFELEAFGEYKEISFGEFETVEYYDLTYSQKEVLNQMILSVVDADFEAEERKNISEKTEYRRNDVDGYMYAINQ